MVPAAQTPTVPHPPERPLLALILRLGAMMLLSTMLMLVKISGEHGIRLPELLFWRQFLPACAIFLWLAAKGELGRLKTDRARLHAQRAVVGTTNMFLFLGAVQVLPLSEATVLNFTTPVFAVLLSALLLHETVGPFRWAAVLLGLAGVLIIVGFDPAHLPPLGVALGLGGALGGAIISIQIRQLARTEESIRVVFWFSAIGAAMLAPGLLVFGRPHDLLDWALIGAIGLTGLGSQILMTAALRFGTVASVIVMDYSQFFWATAFGWLVFAQLPPAATWIGAPVIIAAGVIVALREHRGNRGPSAPS